MNNIIEVFVTSLIIILTILLLVKNLRKKSAGNCNCSCCSNHCPNYNIKLKKN